MIGETILAGTSARCKQAYNRRDNRSLIIGLQSASWWSVNIYCANSWPTIGAPIIVPPILARSWAVSFNSANPTWDGCILTMHRFAVFQIVSLSRALGIVKKCTGSRFEPSPDVQSGKIQGGIICLTFTMSSIYINHRWNPKVCIFFCSTTHEPKLKVSAAQYRKIRLEIQVPKIVDPLERVKRVTRVKQLITSAASGSAYPVSNCIPSIFLEDLPQC